MALTGCFPWHLERRISTQAVRLSKIKESNFLSCLCEKMLTFRRYFCTFCEYYQNMLLPPWKSVRKKSDRRSVFDVNIVCAGRGRLILRSSSWWWSSCSGNACARSWFCSLCAACLWGGALLAFPWPHDAASPDTLFRSKFYTIQKTCYKINMQNRRLICGDTSPKYINRLIRRYNSENDIGYRKREF